MSAQFRLQELIRTKFGDEGYATFFGRPPRPRPGKEEMSRMIEQMFADPKVEQGGQEARVTVSMGGQSEQVWLMRTPEGGWKAWIGAVLQARSPTLIESYVKFNADIGGVRNRVSNEIESGKLTTAQDAKQAMARYEDEETAKLDPATTQPTTPEKAEVELKEKLKLMHDMEAERDRLEREAATRPIGP
jgi:hypothetical protein